MAVRPALVLPNSVTLPGTNPFLYSCATGLKTQTPREDPMGYKTTGTSSRCLVWGIQGAGSCCALQAWPVALSRRSLSLARHKGTHLLGRLSKGHVVFLLRDKSRSQWRNYTQSAKDPGSAAEGQCLRRGGRAATQQGTDRVPAAALWKGGSVSAQGLSGISSCPQGGLWVFIMSRSPSCVTPTLRPLSTTVTAYIRPAVGHL